MLHIAFILRNIYQNKTNSSHNYHSNLYYKLAYIYWFFCGHHYWFHCCHWVHLKERRFELFLHVT